MFFFVLVDGPGRHVRKVVEPPLIRNTNDPKGNLGGENTFLLFRPVRFATSCKEVLGSSDSDGEAAAGRSWSITAVAYWHIVGIWIT